MEVVRSDQVEAAANTLAEAFWDDPLMQIVAPNEKKRAIVAPWFFAKSIAYGLRWGEVSSNDDVSAVAVWFPPGNTEITLGRMLRVGMGALPLRAGSAGLCDSCALCRPWRSFTRPLRGPTGTYWRLARSPTGRAQVWEAPS